MNTTMKKILVVDDSATMRMLVSLTIKKAVSGVSVTEAVNGLDALEKLRKSDFDLVLTDYQMPEMDGPQLIQNIRAEVSGTIPIIIITTKGEEQDRDFGLSVGANGYITKPINSHELKETITKYI